MYSYRTSWEFCFGDVLKKMRKELGGTLRVHRQRSRGQAEKYSSYFRKERLPVRVVARGGREVKTIPQNITGAQQIGNYCNKD